MACLFDCLAFFLCSGIDGRPDLVFWCETSRSFLFLLQVVLPYAAEILKAQLIEADWRSPRSLPDQACDLSDGEQLLVIEIVKTESAGNVYDFHCGRQAQQILQSPTHSLMPN